jgi:hypothetical protein
MHVGTYLRSVVQSYAELHFLFINFHGIIFFFLNMQQIGNTILL